MPIACKVLEITQQIIAEIDSHTCACSSPICAGGHHASVLHTHTPILPPAGVLHLHLWSCWPGDLHKLSGHPMEEEGPVRFYTEEQYTANTNKKWSHVLEGINCCHCSHRWQLICLNAKDLCISSGPFCCKRFCRRSNSSAFRNEVMRKTILSSGFLKIFKVLNPLR